MLPPSSLFTSLGWRPRKTGEEIDVLLGGVKHSDAPDLKAVDADE